MEIHKFRATFNGDPPPAQLRYPQEPGAGTKYYQRMRMVHLRKLDFSGRKIQVIPMDEVRKEDIVDHIQYFS